MEKRLVRDVEAPEHSIMEKPATIVRVLARLNVMFVMAPVRSKIKRGGCLCLIHVLIADLTKEGTASSKKKMLAVVPRLVPILKKGRVKKYEM